MDYTIHLPSKPRIVSEDERVGVYQIDGLYPGYGQTLGNSLRRIILSSLPGAAITAVSIDGVNHEFSTIDGVREDGIALLLNIKKIRVRMHGDEPQTITLSVTGPRTVTAADIETPSQIEIINPEQHIAEVSGKVPFSLSMTVEKGVGYVPRESLRQERVEAGTIALDALFSPTRRVSYEVESMRVGDRTDFNRLTMSIHTDGTIAPREALEQAIVAMIRQLNAVVGFKEHEPDAAALAAELESGTPERDEDGEGEPVAAGDDEEVEDEETQKEFLKTRIESLGFSAHVESALDKASIRTAGGLARKSEADLLALEGLGEKGLQEIRRVLGNQGILLK